MKKLFPEKEGSENFVGFEDIYDKYEQLGFKLWGKLPVYHKLSNGNMVSGNYYYKELTRA